MKRHGHDQIETTAVEKFAAAQHYQSSQRLPQGNLPAIFEFVHHLAHRIICDFLARIAGPRARGGKPRRPRETNTAGVVVSRSVWERATAPVAEWMRNETDVRPTIETEILGIPALDSTTAGAAARRIEPIDDPVESIYKGTALAKLHTQATLANAVVRAKAGTEAAEAE